MSTLLLVVHFLTCVVLVFVVLIQAGKDGGLGAMSGSSQSVFGSSGGANFFTKFTAATAAIFMMTSIALTVLKSGTKKSLFEAGPMSTPKASQEPSPPPAAQTQPQTTTGTATSTGK